MKKKQKVEPKKTVKNGVKSEPKKVVAKKEKPEPVVEPSVPETVVPELARVQSHQVVKS